MDNVTNVGRNDTDGIADRLVPWLSSNDSYDSTIDRLQNFSFPCMEVGDETADLPVLLSVRLTIIIGVVACIIILAWGSLALHRKRIRDSKKRKQRKDMLL